MLLGTLVITLLGNMLVGRGVISVGHEVTIAG